MALHKDPIPYNYGIIGRPPGPPGTGEQVNYYLLRVDQHGNRTFADAEAAKHMIKAASLAEAQAEADRIVSERYAIDDISFLKMFDETGLVAARNPHRDWGN